tara:strand:- start:733 stop:1041 length:309 start_codon:yes stop_codon:yes gene_type:complete
MKNIIKEQSFDDALLIEGSMYTVGTNDGIQFKKVAFLGTRLYHGRPIMVFVTKEDKQITINPSYHSYTIEEEDEMNSVTYSQSGFSDLDEGYKQLSKEIQNG